MKRFLPVLFVMPTLFLSSCSVIGGIFKAGVWVGVLLVLFIIAVILWLATRNSGKS